MISNVSIHIISTRYNSLQIDWTFVCCCFSRLFFFIFLSIFFFSVSWQSNMHFAYRDVLILFGYFFRLLIFVVHLMICSLNSLRSWCNIHIQMCVILCFGCAHIDRLLYYISNIFFRFFRVFVCAQTKKSRTNFKASGKMYHFP